MQKRLGRQTVALERPPVIQKQRNLIIQIVSLLFCTKIY